MVVKALKEGNHQALLLQACSKDHAKAPKVGVWPVAPSLPMGPELQVVVRTTVYQGHQAFQVLRWGTLPTRACN